MLRSTDNRWEISPIADTRTDGTEYVNRYVAIDDDGYVINFQTHTKDYRGYYCHVARGTCSLAATTVMPEHLMLGLSRGHVTLAECDDYLQSILTGILKDALRQDMEHINADKARAWIENEASSMQRFYASAEDPCVVTTYTKADGTFVARESHNTDEGHETRHAEATPHADGTWSLSRNRYSVCCDGPFETLDRYRVENGEVVETERWQRDVYAEMAGY